MFTKLSSNVKHLYLVLSYLFTVAIPGTTCCTLHVDASVEQIQKFYASTGGSSGYDATAIEELPARYERPNDRNRWERPLFVLRPEDDEETLAPLFADVLAAVDGRELKPNLATVQQPVAGPTRCGRCGGWRCQGMLPRGALLDCAQWRAICLGDDSGRRWSRRRHAAPHFPPRSMRRR